MRMNTLRNIKPIVRIMKKKRIIIALALFCLLIMQFTPKCMMIGFHDNFTYLPSGKDASGQFIPYLHIIDNTLSFPFLLFRIDIDKLPHSVFMLQYDQTYLNTDQGFSSFVLDDLYIQFADGTRVDCINPSLPRTQRTYEVSNKANGKFEQQVFDGVITKRMDFSVHTIGTAIKADGTAIPFKRTSKYKYNGKNTTFHTIIDEYASC